MEGGKAEDSSTAGTSAASLRRLAATAAMRRLEVRRGVVTADGEETISWFTPRLGLAAALAAAGKTFAATFAHRSRPLRSQVVWLVRPLGVILL